MGVKKYDIFPLERIDPSEWPDPVTQLGRAYHNYYNEPFPLIKKLEEKFYLNNEYHGLTTYLSQDRKDSMVGPHRENPTLHMHSGKSKNSRPSYLTYRYGSACGDPSDNLTFLTFFYSSLSGKSKGMLDSNLEYLVKDVRDYAPSGRRYVRKIKRRKTYTSFPEKDLRLKVKLKRPESQATFSQAVKASTPLFGHGIHEIFSGIIDSGIYQKLNYVFDFLGKPSVTICLSMLHTNNLFLTNLNLPSCIEELTYEEMLPLVRSAKTDTALRELLTCFTEKEKLLFLDAIYDTL